MKLTKADRLDESNQNNASITNEATGIDFIIDINGVSKIRTNLIDPDIDAKITAVISAKKNPHNIDVNVVSTEFINSVLTNICPSLCITRRGVGSNTS